MFTRWPLMRAALSPDALVTTARLTPSSSSTRVSRMPSRWLSRRKIQWLVRGIVRLQFHVAGAFPGQVKVHHGARDRRRGRAAVDAVLDHYRNRDLRVLDRRVGDEERMVAVLAGEAPCLVARPLLDGDHLRRARFASNGVGRPGRGGGR